MTTRLPLLAGAFLAALALGACAEVPTNPDERAEFESMNDPMEPLNRQIFDLNMALDRAIMKPVAKFYNEQVPDSARQSIHSAFNNLREPYIFINDVLQGEPHQAADALGRFMVNTTFGVLGLFDVVADSGGAQFADSDFGETLAVWGMPEGPYLMLPFFGPSNPRDAMGTAVGFVGDPVGDAVYVYSAGAAYGLGGGNMVDSRAQVVDELDDVERNSIDFYAAIRSLYRQQRASELAKKGVRSPEEVLP